MTKLDRLKTEIESLTPEDFAYLRDWLAEKDWENWDKQIEADSESGKLDFLAQEALTASTSKRWQSKSLPS